MSRPLLYVAAPYTYPDPAFNVHRVAKVASAIWDHSNLCPVVPHLTMLWHLVDPKPVSFWYEYDLHVMKGCQFMTRLPGASVGADNEEKIIKRQQKIIYVPFEELPEEAQLAWG